jgi:hypothetical protein
MTAARFAVVGAGIAGLACARRLAATGHPVQVFDKGRSPGGRLATRRGERAAWDHGAQYFTVRDAGFAEVVVGAEAAGQVARWLPRWPGGEQEQRDLWVGVPGSSALPRWLAQGLDLVTEARILRLDSSGPSWSLADDQGRVFPAFDFVVLAVPAPQAALLAEGHGELAGRAAAVTMAPCWAVMAAFESPIEVPADADWSPDTVLPWIARNSSKPRRSGLDAWVLHADAAWSQEHFDASVAEVQSVLLERLATRLGTSLPPVAVVESHRWRYARVEAALGESYLLDAESRIATCGDWCVDARVEAAWLSGDALGRALAGEPAA